MKPCVVIPVFNHASTVMTVVAAARAHLPVIVADDGSTDSPPYPADLDVVRLGRNQGKGAALRAGFQRAVELGYTHAITMDADGQHYAEDLPKFLAAAGTQPDALAVGVRDFFAAGCPTHRRRSNAVSTFWFRVETGIRLGDTQCGFRCYPLALTQHVRTRSGRYAFELEFMVRSAWIGTPVVAVPVKCNYDGGIRNSHFRPVKDLAHITFMNIGLVLQSWFVPLPLRVAWSAGERQGFWGALREIFTDEAHEPGKLALAVGLGLFCGLAPFWGIQAIVAMVLAHRFHLNKLVTLLASNVSIPPAIPFIIYGELLLGHWLFTGAWVQIAPHDITRAMIMDYFWQWFIGSLIVAVAVALPGTAVTYVIARLFNRK